MINYSLLLDFEDNNCQDNELVGKMRMINCSLQLPENGEPANCAHTQSALRHTVLCAHLKSPVSTLCCARTQSARKHTLFLVAMMQNGFGPTLTVGDVCSCLKILFGSIHSKMLISANTQESTLLMFMMLFNFPSD